jgi:hypothetical protein
MFRRSPLTLLAILVLTPLSCVSLVSAQRRGGAARSFSAGHGANRGTHRSNGDGFLGAPFFYPDYDYGESYAPNAGEEAPPPMVITRPDSPRTAKATPLLIEWRGDRYIRYGGTEETAQRGTSTHPDYSEPPSGNAPAKPALAAAPAVLVYRDGRRQEISNYAIADGVIYVQGSYWQNGSKANSIPLTALDQLATMQANQQRGVNFILPSASNVVIASF